MSNDPLQDITMAQLPPNLQKAALKLGWESLMPVQSRAIPYLLANRNVMVQARTGSGKTGAFLLPMLEKLDASRNNCQALVLVPTRELAAQVWQEAGKICDEFGLASVAVYGGVGYSAQMEAFKKGAQIVIGTPGRILDHLIRGSLSLENLRMLIYDEADRMLSMGFYPDMIKMRKFFPKKNVLGSMFSATFPFQILRSAGEFIDDPEFISLSEDHIHVTETEHVYYVVNGMDKDRSLIRIIEMENPTAAFIFCNTKSEVHYVSTVLQQFGYDADELTSELTQSNRERVLQRVRKSALRFLVATDVAARGLDIPSLTHVIQYETPEDFEAYIHRAGRTGRAGAAGVAISLVTDMELFTLRRIAKRFNIAFQEKTNPTDADVEAIVSQRVIALLEARLRDRELRKTERSRRFVALGRSLVDNEDESAIIAMLLDDFYQQTLNAAVLLPEEEKEKENEQKPSVRKEGRRRGRTNKLPPHIRHRANKERP